MLTFFTTDKETTDVSAIFGYLTVNTFYQVLVINDHVFFLYQT